MRKPRTRFLGSFAKVAAVVTVAGLVLTPIAASAQEGEDDGAESDDDDWEDEEEKAPPPPLPKPSADEQDPAPVPHSSGRPKERLAEVGGIIGIAQPVVGDSDVNYDAAPLFAAYARVPLWEWTALRFLYTRSNHAVQGVPATQGAEASKQPNLDILKLQARAELTWHIIPGLELYGGVGIAWGRLEADSVKNAAKDRLIYLRRGVQLEYSGVLGASYEVLPRWVALGVDVSGAMYGDQSGSVFRAATDTYGGETITVAGLPRFDSGWAAGVSAAVLF